MQSNTSNQIKEIIKEDLWDKILEFLNIGFHINTGKGEIHLTIGLLLLLITALITTNYVLKWLRLIFTRKMVQDDKLKFISVFKFIKYIVYLVVILLTFNAAGINVTVLLTASAAFFVGLGLALQELFQDVIAGIFIITDKSLVVGDIIEVDGKVGKVFEIKLRTTRALTRDDKVIIIPNHKFISDVIFNYTQNHNTTREFVQVGVAYGSDVQKVEKLLLEAVSTQVSVFKTPEPFVLFEDFADSALLFLSIFLQIIALMVRE